MSKYENKTNEELIELLESKDERINDLEECEQSCEELESEIRCMSSDGNDYDKAIKELATIAEKSFYAGRNSDLKSTQLKSWLNYKMEEML